MNARSLEDGFAVANGSDPGNKKLLSVPQDMDVFQNLGTLIKDIKTKK